MSKNNDTKPWMELAACVCSVATKYSIPLTQVARETNHDYRTLHRWLVEKAHEPSASVALTLLAWVSATVIQSGSQKEQSIPFNLIKRWTKHRKTK